MAGWEKHYPGMVEWIDADTHGGIKNVNPDTMEIETDLDTFKADVACVPNILKRFFIFNLALKKLLFG